MTTVNELPLILQLDVAGQPQRWINYERSAYYYAKDRVAWSMGEVDVVLHGGTSRMTGEQSVLTMDTIIAVRQENGKKANIHRTPTLTNRALFRRDQHICAYCGNEFSASKLTRDHVIPVSKGGPNIWTNVVTSCSDCNRWKDNRTPEEADMELVYVPYAPNKAEYLILMNRTILADQMEFLLKQVSRDSRLLN